MDFDQMLATWRTQDAAPLYGVNQAALRQALQTEESAVRRKRRRDMWIICVGLGGTAVIGGFWIAISITNGWPAIYTVAAAVGFATGALYVGAYGISRWREAQHERNFGGTLQEEVRRGLWRVDLELSRFGNWTSASLQIAPILLSAMLISWAMSGSQGHVPWSSYVVGACAMVYLVRYARRYARQKLEPRQRRLRELLDALDARE